MRSLSFFLSCTRRRAGSERRRRTRSRLSSNVGVELDLLAGGACRDARELVLSYARRSKKLVSEIRFMKSRGHAVLYSLDILRVASRWSATNFTYSIISPAFIPIRSTDRASSKEKKNQSSKKKKRVSSHSLRYRISPPHRTLASRHPAAHVRAATTTPVRPPYRMPWNDELACKEVDDHIRKHVKDNYSGARQLHEIPFALWEVKFGVERIQTKEARFLFGDAKKTESFYFDNGVWMGSICFAKHASGFAHYYDDKFDMNKAHVKPPSRDAGMYLQMAKNAKEKKLNVRIVIAHGNIRAGGNGCAFVYKLMKIDAVYANGIDVSVADGQYASK